MTKVTPQILVAFGTAFFSCSRSRRFFCPNGILRRASGLSLCIAPTGLVGFLNPYRHSNQNARSSHSECDLVTTIISAQA